MADTAVQMTGVNLNNSESRTPVVHQNVLLITQTRSDRELPQHQLQREDEERLPVQEEGHAEEHPRRAQVSLTLF